MLVTKSSKEPRKIIPSKAIDSQKSLRTFKAKKKFILRLVNPLKENLAPFQQLQPQISKAICISSFCKQDFQLFSSRQVQSHDLDFTETLFKERESDIQEVRR